jgi:hypothetical protein
MEKKHPTLLMPIFNGAMSRLLVYSGVVNRLAELGARIVILNPDGGRSPLREFTDARVEFDSCNPPLKNLHDQYFVRLYHYLFQTILPTKTNLYREKQIRINEPLRYWMIRTLKGTPSHLLLTAMLKLRQIAMPARFVSSALRKYQPDLIVVHTMGKAALSHYALRYARLSNTRSLCTVQSWDHLTMKEYPLARPDKLIVWNEPNKEEAQRLHNFQAEDVYVSGVPQFDIYFGELSSREEWLVSQGLDPGRRLITITPQPSASRPRILDDVVQCLAQAIQTDRLAQPCQVLIRPYPQVNWGKVQGQGTEEDLRRYESLNPHIHGNRPKMSGANISGDVHPSELPLVARMLNHSDVVLDFFGTISVEACAMDTPTIYVDLPPNAAHQGDDVKIGFRNFDHINQIVRLGGARIAETPEALIETINTYLLHPELERKGRRRVAETLCYKTDGRSSQRMANALYHYASGTWPPPEV